MDGEARELFATFGISDGDVGEYAAGLAATLRRDFTAEMQRLRDPAFQDLLVKYPRRKRVFVRAIENQDEVSSEYLFRDAAGREYKPEDYLEAFARFVRDNLAQVKAIRILLDRPRDWSTAALAELRDKLRATPEHFTVDNLQKAHQCQYHKVLVDVISMVKHAADGQSPLLTAAERIERAFAKFTAGRTSTPAQGQWLERIWQHLVANLSIGREDFEDIRILYDSGGWGVANRAFDGGLDWLIEELNAAMAV